jgi:hypothetical protein
LSLPTGTFGSTFDSTLHQSTIAYSVKMLLFLAVVFTLHQSTIAYSVKMLLFLAVVLLAAIIPMQILYTNNKMYNQLTYHLKWGWNHQSILWGASVLAWPIQVTNGIEDQHNS